MKHHLFSKALILSLLLALTVGMLGVTPAYAATLTVANSNDSGPGSLRQAIADAVPGDIITFSGDMTIPLASELVISKDLTIDATPNSVIVSGENVTRVFNVTDGTVAFNHLTIANGNVQTFDCGGYPFQCGGGLILQSNDTIHVTVTNSIFSSNQADYGGGIDHQGSGTLVIVDSTFSDNSASSKGGGIHTFSGTLTVTNSTFSNNSADWRGGGINQDGGTVTVTNSTFSDNNANEGGGIYNYIGALTVTNSTISHNSAGWGGGLHTEVGTLTVTNSNVINNTASTFGGGIYNAGKLTVNNNNVAGNSSYLGGGIFNHGEADIANSTFSKNSVSESGGGIYNDDIGILQIVNSTFFGNTADWDSGGIQSRGGTITIDSSTFYQNSAGHIGGGLASYFTSAIVNNTIIADNLGENCDTTMNPILGANNLTNDSSCGDSFIISSTIRLGTLGDYGGYTQTIPLLSGSSAIDAGNDATCPTTDQRGTTRPQGAACDIGAFEYVESVSPPPPAVFADVPLTHWANEWVEKLYRAGITSGCSTEPHLLYCPEATVTRAQMAIFILRGIHGSAYTPPAATGTVFSDVPLGSFADAWIEQLASEGITTGCGNGNYCPEATITRAEMSIFLLRGKFGSAYTPPTATGTVFSDVPLGSFADAWIEQLAITGITTGCGNGNYCPDAPVTRAEMAVFLVKTFNLP